VTRGDGPDLRARIFPDGRFASALVADAGDRASSVSIQSLGGATASVVSATMSPRASAIPVARSSATDAVAAPWRNRTFGWWRSKSATSAAAPRRTTMSCTEARSHCGARDAKHAASCSRVPVDAMMAEMNGVPPRRGLLAGRSDLPPDERFMRGES
jgi:hypothetical protein